MPKKWRSNDELRWILVDFDGTICTSKPPDYEPGDEVPGARSGLLNLQAEGWKVIIYTSRPWADYELIESWLRVHDIPVRRIICGKPLGKYMIDDRNIEFRGDWAEALSKVR